MKNPVDSASEVFKRFYSDTDDDTSKARQEAFNSESPGFE